MEGIEKTTVQATEEQDTKVEGFYTCENKEETCLNDCPFSSAIYTTDH